MYGTLGGSLVDVYNDPGVQTNIRKSSMDVRDINTRRSPDLKHVPVDVEIMTASGNENAADLFR